MPGVCTKLLVSHDLSGCCAGSGFSLSYATALMEYHCTKAANVAINIFEAGMKVFAEDVEYVTRYLAFLININDENSEFVSTGAFI